MRLAGDRSWAMNYLLNGKIPSVMLYEIILLRQIDCNTNGLSMLSI
jgi:hypothetical protein